MKKTLFFLFVPFVAFAICQECDSFRSSLLTRNQDITAEVSGIYSDVGLILAWSADIASSSSDDNSKYTANNIYTQSAILQARADIALEMLASNRVEILSFNCDCSSSSGCECAGVLTNIYDSLLNIEVYARETSFGMETLLHDLETFKTLVVSGFVNVSNQVDYLNFLVDHGFSDVTNELSYLELSNTQFSAFNPSTGLNGLYGLRTLSQGTRFSVGSLPLNTISANSRDNGWLPSLWWQSFDQLKILGSLNSFELNKYLNVYGPLTNNLINIADDIFSLTDSTTNFFSFFRGEIGVHGVLEDWTEQDGSYYDFLTNHYIQLVTGCTLSGNQSSKTNWFSRIETLLAALVFGDDGTSTNTVDSSMGDELKSQISSSFNQLIDGPQNGMVQDLEEITPSVIAQVRRFSSVFSSASMPSNITLFSQDGENGFKIAFEISNDSVYYDIFRNITTLCWSLVGLFFVYRFLVWSITKIVVLVQFCFNVFTDIFKAR